MKKLQFILFFALLAFPVLSFAECTGNCKNGSGILNLSDGTKYVGHFKDGKYHGRGILTLPDGTKYVGEFSNGKFVKSTANSTTNNNSNTYNSNSVSNCNTNCINGKCTKTCCKNGKCTTIHY